MMRPSFAQEDGNVKWVATPNTPQGDIGHQVDKVGMISL